MRVHSEEPGRRSLKTSASGSAAPERAQRPSGTEAPGAGRRGLRPRGHLPAAVIVSLVGAGTRDTLCLESR